MQQNRQRTGVFVIVAFFALAGCNVGNRPRNLVDRDLDQSGLIAGSVTGIKPDADVTGGFVTTTAFTVNVQNSDTGKKHAIRMGSAIQSHLIKIDTLIGDVYAKPLPPGNYEFVDWTATFTQHIPTSRGMSVKTAEQQKNLNAPFVVRAGEIQYLGELQFDVSIDRVSIDRVSWIPGETVDEYLQIKSSHHDSFSRDIGILAEKFPEISWAQTKPSLNVLAGPGTSR